MAAIAAQARLKRSRSGRRDCRQTASGSIAAGTPGGSVAFLKSEQRAMVQLTWRCN